jgi:hypothetical protein
VKKQLKTLANPTITEVMDDCFSATFARGLLRDSWQKWRVYLSALFGLAMNADALEIYRKHTGRSDTPTKPFHESYVIAGRRAGKSIISAAVATFLAAFRDYSSVLAPGEVGTLMVISADRKQARTIFGYISAFFAKPLLAKLVVKQTKDAIELSTCIRIEIHTCSFKSTRGYSCIGIVADETAFWRSEESANPDTEVLNALRPSLATTNGLLLCISSPYSKRGALYDAFRRHYGKASDVLVWRASSREMNPSLSAAVVALAYLSDPQAAKAEYGGEFRDDISAFLPLEAVEACVVRDRHDLPPMDGVSYYAFCDPSGGSSDSMTLAIAHTSGLDANQRIVLDLLRERIAPFSPDDCVREFALVLKKFRLYCVVGDHYSAEWVKEAFAKQGIEYRASDKTRSEIYAEILPHFMTRSLELLDNRKLVAQFASLERRTARAGRDSIDHPVGSHDDCSNAAAGCLVLAAAETSGVFGLLELQARGEALQAIEEPSTTVSTRTEPVPGFGSSFSVASQKFPPILPPRAKAFDLPPCQFCGGEIRVVSEAMRTAACTKCHAEVQVHEKSPYGPTIGQNRGDYLASRGRNSASFARGSRSPFGRFGQ